MEFALKDLRRDWIEGLSGEAFHDRVESYLRALESLPPEVRARGALIAEKDPVEFAAAFFASVSLGIPTILANPHWGGQEWAEFSRLVRPGISLGRGGTCDTRAVLPGVDAALPLPSRSEIEGKSSAPPPESILIPTGGSTGGVKLAIHTWASLEAACRGLEDFLGGGAIDSCCVLPLYHVSGLMQLLRSFITGGRIRFDEDEVDGRCLSYVPTQLRRALASEAHIQKLASARAIFVGGAALPDALAQQARARQLPIIPVYGMTETAAMVAAMPIEDFLKNPTAGAVPLGDARFSVEPDGRLRIQSLALFQGYQDRPPVDRKLGYVSDDEARIDRRGRLHLIGRMDRLINTGGEKVAPCEVEAALLQIEGVREARAVGQPDPEWGQRVVAYYTGEAVEADELKKRLRDYLAPYKVPKSLIHMDALPLDGKGKFVGYVGAS
jgi:O-succinylbenzoic acid--CoA ligase